MTCSRTNRKAAHVAVQDDVWAKATGSNPAKTAETRLVDTDNRTANISAACSDLQVKGAQRQTALVDLLNTVLARLDELGAQLDEIQESQGG